MTSEETIEVDIEEATSGAMALTAVERAAIDSQVATAKQYPRSVTKSVREALTMATMDEDTAASCFYCLPRAGKRIEGPSARLAEIMAYSWGNFRADADVVSEDRTHITAVGTAFDVEKNVAIRVRVRRRITKKSGVRYDDDMIGVAGNAAISIALRNAVFKVIPRSVVNKVYQAARKASLGEGGTITQKRQKALDWFAKLGVSEDEVFGVLGVKGMDDIGEDELITLRGMVTAIQDGEANVEQMFRPHRSRSDGAEELNEKLGQKPMEEAKPGFEPDAEPAPADPTQAEPDPSPDPAESTGTPAEEPADPSDRSTDRQRTDLEVSAELAKLDEMLDLDRECHWAFGKPYAEVSDASAIEVMETLKAGKRVANIGLRTRADVAREIGRVSAMAGLETADLKELAAEKSIAWTGEDLTKCKNDVLAALLDAVREHSEMVGE